MKIERFIRIETGAARAEITALSWDTEGTGREQTSLLRSGTAAGLRFCVDGQWLNGADLPTRVESNATGGVTYRITVAPAAEINWHIEAAKGRLTLQCSGEGTGICLAFSGDYTSRWLRKPQAIAAHHQET